ncbi:AAA family ATPase [Streptomyces nanshensis]|uniref:AAA family ATPase n=1 Tax=Streptomyces nanshensis TaxID=518642 RepID=UPI0014956631|nr:AAA family ATPase [Streptomyces nanshensis]
MSHLTPVGVQMRPNGQKYHPRNLAGVEDLAFLRDARRHREHVLMDGPPGAGKTAMVEAAFAADATNGHPGGVETIVGTGSTEVPDFVGTFVQNPATKAYEWMPGPLMRSVENDVPLFVDEIALIDARVLSVLYPLMDGRDELRIEMNPTLPPMKVGPGWFVIGACNRDVPGAHLSDALVSRFDHHFQVTTDWDLAADLGVPLGLIKAAKNLEERKAQATYEGWIPQMRDALSFAECFSRHGQDFAVASLLRKCPAADREDMAETLASNLAPAEPLTLGARMRKPRQGRK